MVESISELMDPLEEDDEIKKLKEQLSDLQVRQQQKKNPKEIASIKKIEKELQENEHKTWMRCCTITGQLLENINKVPPLFFILAFRIVLLIIHRLGT